jgi:16S rRNA G966 N2-methylase RsmD
MITQSYKWHPQPSSIRKSEAAAKRANIKGAVVLDCFCGTGSHAVASIRSGAKKYIGTDLENYSFCLRKEIARYNTEYATFGERTISFQWGIPAAESINMHDFDILFVDPPNPYQIVGAYSMSIPRDTGLNGGKLTKFWKERLSEENWINKKGATLENVISLFHSVLSKDKRIIANLFNTKSHNKFDYFAVMEDFKKVQLFETYYELFKE